MSQKYVTSFFVGYFRVHHHSGHARRFVVVIINRDVIRVWQIATDLLTFYKKAKNNSKYMYRNVLKFVWKLEFGFSVIGLYSMITSYSHGEDLWRGGIACCSNPFVYNSAITFSWNHMDRDWIWRINTEMRKTPLLALAWIWFVTCLHMRAMLVCMRECNALGDTYTSLWPHV